MHTFSVWGPKAGSVAVKVGEKSYPMQGPNEKGYWTATVQQAVPGDDYGFLLDADDFVYPDPRSAWQPNGVHKPSRIYDQDEFHWDDARWQGPPLNGAVIYELHIGTFTPEGNFDAAIRKLDYLSKLGITHIEVMPIAEAAGNRGWGYDGVDLFASSSCYGGPNAFKRFVNAAHVQGLGVILDVVYNHFGPVGNYTGKFGPYTTDRHKTPWGDAVNLEDRGSDEVRKFFLDNAIFWMRHYHVDGLRLDAVHELNDRSAVHFLEQLSANVDNLSATLGRRLFLIAESDLNNPAIVRPIEANGLGMDAQWSDDFHHSLFTLLHVEKDQTKGYYSDFGEFECLAKSLKDMFVFDGQYSEYRERHHGRPVDSLSAHHFIGFIQNHDQVGNRATGDRLEHIIGVPRTKVALGIVMTAPFIPMIFQGEEFAASTPFLYFADHEDTEMAKQVAAGRKKEFLSLGWDQAQIPNPEAMSTFTSSKLNWEEMSEAKQEDILEWTARLIHIRRNSIALNDGDRGHLKVTFSEEKKWLRMDRTRVTIVANLGPEPCRLTVGDDYEILLASISRHTTLIDGHLTVPPDGFVIVSAEDE